MDREDRARPRRLLYLILPLDVGQMLAVLDRCFRSET